MWSRVVYGGLYVPYNYSKFICDTTSDLLELPTSRKASKTNGIKSCSVGSIAIVINDNSTYMLNNQDEWKEFKSAGSELNIDGDILTAGEKLLIAKN